MLGSKRRLAPDCALFRFASRAGRGALAATPAFAQDAPPAANDDVEKVTVTAQKRKQNILDVGLNVSVVTGSDTRDRRVEQMRDLTGSMSNLDVKEQVPGAMPVITIRGVGLDDFSSTNNPSAGVYIDEVFLSSLAMMSFDVFDLERIEVLKGPQGTLYGRNSTAGAINVITAKPSTDAFDAFASAGYGNFQTFDAEGMLNAAGQRHLRRPLRRQDDPARRRLSGTTASSATTSANATSWPAARKPPGRPATRSTST